MLKIYQTVPDCVFKPSETVNDFLSWSAKGVVIFEFWLKLWLIPQFWVLPIIFVLMSKAVAWPLLLIRNHIIILFKIIHLAFLPSIFVKIQSFLKLMLLNKIFKIKRRIQLNVIILIKNSAFGWVFIRAIQFSLCCSQIFLLFCL